MFPMHDPQTESSLLRDREKVRGVGIACDTLRCAVVSGQLTPQNASALSHVRDSRLCLPRALDCRHWRAMPASTCLRLAQCRATTHRRVRRPPAPLCSPLLRSASVLVPAQRHATLTGAKCPGSQSTRARTPSRGPLTQCPVSLYTRPPPSSSAPASLPLPSLVAPPVVSRSIFPFASNSNHQPAPPSLRLRVSTAIAIASQPSPPSSSDHRLAEQSQFDLIGSPYLRT